MSVAEFTDLNQLRTFVLLCELRSVTATAERLHVTQPTVSYTLGRLRRRFDDELFRRHGNVLVPTPRAARLFGPLRDALAQIDATVADPDDVDPATLTGEFAIALTTLGEQTFLPAVVAATRREGPRLHLRIIHVDAVDVEESLVRGETDLAISVSLFTAERLWRTPFQPVEYVAVTASDRPLPATGPGMFAGRQFVRVSARGGHTFPNRALVEHGLSEQVSLSMEGYANVPGVLEASDLVALLPRHVAETIIQRFTGLRLSTLPWPVQSPPVALYSRPEQNLSPAQRWFRQLVLDAITPAR